MSISESKPAKSSSKSLSSSRSSKSSSSKTDSSSAKSPTPPKKKLRNCVFNKAWLDEENFKTWLLPNRQNPNLARCSVCNTDFTIQYDGVKAVKTHAEGKKHKKSVGAVKMTNCMSKFYLSKSDDTIADKVAVAKLAKALHCVKHAHSYFSSDCGAKLDALIYQDSEIATKLRLGRTKMQSLVIHVLCPYVIECMTRSLKNQPFLVGTDASNKGNRKCFPMCTIF